LDSLKPKLKNNEDIKEKLVMKDFNPNQKNEREDGELGPNEDEHDHNNRGQGPQGMPCQAQ
jgi:hypothetical protein